jgi:hypothetical protein
VATAVTVVESATATVATATTTLTTATAAVESQTAVVEVKAEVVESATAVVNANTSPGLNITIIDSADNGASPTVGEGTVVYTGKDTNGISEQWGSGGPTVNGGTTVVTETFANNRLNTEIGITVNGTPVSTTNNNEVYIGSIGFPGPGQDPSLTLRGSTADTLITMPANTVAASFQVFAKNGDHDAVVTYTDGTTGTFSIQNNVSETYPNYVHQEVITAPEGKKIASINIPANWDYYGVDNVSATKQATTTIVEGFQVKWDGIWTPQTTGTQYITAPADDGVILKLDGQTVINDWVDKGGGGSTADIETTAGVGKTFEMWYYENGGGAAVSLLRYNGSTWEVIPASEFSTSSATPQQVATLQAANAELSASTAILTTVTADKVVAETNLTVAQTTLTTANETLTAEQQNLAASNQNLSIAIQTADTLANVAVTKVNEAVTAMTNAAQVTVNYYAEQQAAAQAAANAAAQAAAAQAAQEAAAQAAANAAAEAAAQQAAAEAAAAEAAAKAAAEAAVKAEAEAKAAAEAAAKAEAEAKAAEEAAAKAEADRVAAEEAAAKAEADRVAAEEAAAKAEQESKEQAEADAKAEADRLEAEAEAAAQAEADAKAEAEAKAQEEADAKAEAEAKAQEAANAKAEAEAKAAELEAAKAEAEELKKAAEEGKLTEEQKEVVVNKILEEIKPGEAVSSADIKAAGVSYSDLPPATPVDVRTDENGNAVVITAAVAAQVELLQNPSALVEELFTNPAAALAAFGSIGADMSDEEREEATDMVVATVVAAGAAINAAAVATGGATGGGTGGGGSSGGGSGANSPGSRGGRRW